MKDLHGDWMSQTLSQRSVRKVVGLEPVLLGSGDARKNECASSDSRVESESGLHRPKERENESKETVRS